jgi:hypothetical protein
MATRVFHLPGLAVMACAAALTVRATPKSAAKDATRGSAGTRIES